MQSVELRIIGDPRGIDLTMPRSRGGEEAAIAGIADPLLIAAFQFAAQAGDDGVTRSGVTACLGGIETDHVATRLYPRPPVAGDHLLPRCRVRSPARAEWSAAPSARDRSVPPRVFRTSCARGHRGCNRYRGPRVRRSSRY